MRYLKGTAGQGIILHATKDFQLKAFVDPDWGACLDTRRSVTGYCIFLGDSLISWKSKKQAIVSRSSAEAEYRAIAMVSSEITWLFAVLSSLQLTSPTPALIYCDNQAAISIANNPIFHERIKHIEIDCHFIRDKIEMGMLKLLPVRSAFQLVDMFTKALSAPVLKTFMNKMGIFDLHGPS